ncbi:LptF/LptG family permease [Flammeovirga kamogawensis]|uniref:LptF/LptG family permease n=1 Tax=Flammeovirga kamogawensis TaxID=373891 RepID=A0ABX8GWU2_9BACT|nr:LptF/LptG family permease [Flammeovirga kamogawensis]MBB6460651.1 lipopolysaccharide export system permease protein [Flammeovirga kamogawensis]QWG08006.1 LptF/LptG family permease [Flammeovirga kamogawensis]TRX69813.1 YjgP/YjgQ family permease [Flammeovirga kamogawensis]
MKLLDKYILTKFFKTFIFVVLLLNIIVCVIDYTEKQDDFLNHGLNFGYVFSEYYVNLFIHWVNTLSPLSIFIAVVFMTARLTSHTEVIAVLSNGVSYPRFLLPYIVGASIIGGIIFGLIGYVVPYSAKTRVAFEIKYLKSPYYFNERDIHYRVSDSTYLYVESYNNRIKRGYRPTLETFDGNKLLEKISANRIQWDSAKEEWTFDKYEKYTFNVDGTQKFAKGTSLTKKLNLDPKYFESKYNLHETLTNTELSDFIQQERQRGVGNLGIYENALYERYAYPFAILLLTIMGVCVSSTKSRHGSGFQIAMGFVLAFIYLLFVIMSRAIAEAGTLSPFLAAWMPNIVFLFVTIGLYFKAQK